MADRIAIKKPASFDPAHPNRFASDGGGGVGSGGLVSKKDRMFEELGLDGEEVVSSDEDRDEDPASAPYASGGSTALKAKMAKLQEELDVLSDKLTKVCAVPWPWCPVGRARLDARVLSKGHWLWSWLLWRQASWLYCTLGNTRTCPGLPRAAPPGAAAQSSLCSCECFLARARLPCSGCWGRGGVPGRFFFRWTFSEGPSTWWRLCAG